MQAMLGRNRVSTILTSLNICVFLGMLSDSLNSLQKQSLLASCRTFRISYLNAGCLLLCSLSSWSQTAWIIFWDPGYGEANPWLSFFHCVYFSIKVWNCCQPSTSQMHDESKSDGTLFQRFIIFDTHTTGWSGAQKSWQNPLTSSICTAITI